MIVDVRSEPSAPRDGGVPGAIYHPRNVLEWRCDPESDAATTRLADLDRHVIVMCDEGYASSLAAATLQELGFSRATDLDGGFQAWRAAGLPVEQLRQAGESAGADLIFAPCPCARAAAAADLHPCRPRPDARRLALLPVEGRPKDRPAIRRYKLGRVLDDLGARARRPGRAAPASGVRAP